MISLAVGRMQVYILISFALQYAYIVWETFFLQKTGLQHSNFGNYAFWLNMCILGQPTLTIIYYLCYLNHL